MGNESGPRATAGWQWWQRTQAHRSARLPELALGCATVLVVSVIGGIYAHATGPSDSGAWALQGTLIGVLLLAAVAGARQQGGPRWTTLTYTAAFAVVAGWTLVGLAGPDSGTAGACGPGEDCGMEQGVGFIMGPLMLAPFVLAAMAASRGLTALLRRTRSNSR